MKGLLGKVGEAARSPSGTGAILAGAFGVNPLLGLLAGPAIKNNRERRALELEGMREGLLAKQRQRQAIEQLPGAMRPDPLMEGIEQHLPRDAAQRNAQERQARVMGLLGDLSPDHLASGVASQLFPSDQQRRIPADLQIMESLGLPMNAEGYAQLQSMKADPGQAGMLDLILKGLNIQSLEAGLSDRRDAAETRRADRDAATRSAQVSINRTLANARELSDLNNFLSSTIAETGTPWPEMARILVGGTAAVRSALGYDTQKAREVATAFDRFTQLSTDFGLDMIEKLKGTGAISDTKFQTLLANTVNTRNSPDANALALADIVDAALDGADAMDFSISERRQFEDMSRNLRQMSPLTMPEGGMTFSTEAEAEKAAREGRIKIGDEIIIGGRRIRVEQ